MMNTNVETSRYVRALVAIGVSVVGVVACQSTDSEVLAESTSSTRSPLLGNECTIGGVSYAAGATDSLGCRVCDPLVSQTSWTNKPACDRLIVAVTNTPKFGDFGGVYQADAACANEGAALGLPGVWKAMVSKTGTRHFEDAVPVVHWSKPVVNLQGQEMYSSWSSIFANQIWPAGISAFTFGSSPANVVGSPYAARVWTGSGPDGKWLESTDGSDNCKAWTTRGYSSWGVTWQTYRGVIGDFSQRKLVNGGQWNCDSSATTALSCVLVPPGPELSGWTLTWSDEFDGPDGSPVDPTKWQHEERGDGGGNNELQYYTSGTANAVQQGGNLVITAKREGASEHTCWNGPCRYTSARVRTKGLFSQTYGRFSARMKLPRGKGLWSAFWMLGENIDEVGWPQCGELDIMEAVDSRKVYGTLHTTFPGYNPQGTHTLPGNASYADAFHTFTMEWDPGVVRFSVDDTVYYSVKAVNMLPGTTWLYNKPLYMLLNLAVGGDWPGAPNAETVFPQTLEVDWVRVYRRLAE